MYHIQHDMSSLMTHKRINYKALILTDRLRCQFSELPQAVSKISYEGTWPDAKVYLAIVGSRKHSSYGETVLNELFQGLKGREVCIISGLAIGLDSLAHKLALDNGLKTIAVMPCGLNKTYPARHYYLRKQIVKAGGLIMSEYEDDEPARKHHFIARNRLIAACSDAVLIPEAAHRSGSLHTASFANELGTNILAVPGPITSPLSAGTNSLIADGAQPILGANQLVEYLGFEGQKLTQTSLIQDPEQAQVLELLKKGVKTPEDLLQQSKISYPVLQSTLTMLEIEGIIVKDINGWSFAHAFVY